MTSKLLISVLLVGSVCISACEVKKSTKVNKDLQKQTSDNQKKTEDTLSQLNKLMAEGGQPGQIKISGVLVNSNSEIDERITVLAKTGTGKDGSQPQVTSEHMPALSQTNEEVKLSSLESMNTLISVGCDENVILDLAQTENLEIQKLPAPLTKDLMIISAKLVVLCGQLEDLKFEFLNVQADELVLDSVDFTKTGWLGETSLSTNKLHLMGANKITTKGIDSSTILAPIFTIELNVMKEISSSQDGTLSIMSFGANYKAKP